MKHFASWLVSAAVAALFLAAFFSQAQAQPSAQAYWGEIKGSDVRIRTGPSSNHSIVKAANSGDRYIVIGEQAGWLKLQMTAEFECWIQATLAQVQGQQAFVSVTVANLRPAPNTDGSRLGTAQRGEHFTILESKNGWLRVVPPRGVGVWVHGDFIKKVAQATDADIADSIAKGAAAGRAVQAQQQQPQQQPQVGLRPVDATEARPIAAADSKVKAEYDKLVQRYDALIAAGDGVSLDEIAEVAHYFNDLAQVCANVELKSLAKDRAQLLASLKARLEQEQAKALKAQGDASQGDPQEKARRERMLARLVYSAPSSYTAEGTIADGRDDQGRRIYLLVQNKQVLFKLELAPEAANVDLRELWNRQVGINGKVVTMEGETYSVLVISKIDPK